MSVLLPVLVVAAAAVITWGLSRLARAVSDARSEAAQTRTLQLLRLFAPGLAAAAADPQSLLSWQPLAATARQLFPKDFETIDRAAGAPFPFSQEQIDRAHARWTADWLAWEQAHDSTSKLKVAQAEAEFAASPLLRAKLDAIEREKLELYQAHYREYVRVAKALQTLKAPR